MSTSASNNIILAGGTGALDPQLYEVSQVAGYGSSIYDLSPEPPQPAGWTYGTPPLWPEIWLGVE